MSTNRVEIIRATTIATNDMNKQLSALYEVNWVILRKTANKYEAQGNELANPYLLATTNAYASAKIRVMCLGKETMGWGGEFTGQPTIKELQQLYTLYIHQEGGNDAAFHRFVGWLSSLSPDVEVIPNNIIKIGKKNTNGYYKVVANELHSVSHILKEEISILNPSVIVCPTSNLYDYNKPLTELLGDSVEKVLQQDLFVSERRYEAFPNTTFIMCPHPQGKSTEEMNKVKQIISGYILKLL